MQYAENRKLRQQIYTAYVTRASSGEMNNTAVIDETLQLRKEAARLLGFDNYASYSLATKMANSSTEVIKFLRELATKSRKMAENEIKELKAFAKEHLELDELNAWDIPFASEQLRRHIYDLSEEELKPYFPANRVLDGMFKLVETLYGIEIREGNAPKWHHNVHYFDIFAPR